MRLRTRFPLRMAWLAVAVASMPSSVAAGGRDPDSLRELFPVIEEHVREEMRLNRIPGLALAVADSNGILYLKAFGVRDLATGEAMTEDTPVELASVSKSLTALAVLQLAEGGLLDLDDPVGRHLPLLQDGEDRAFRDVRVRHLMDHTSGLTRQADWLVPCCGEPGDLDLSLAVSRLLSARLKTPPGSVFRYANSNYVLLAALVAEVTSVPFPQYMEDSVLKPLGMERATLKASRTRALKPARFHERRWGRVRPSDSSFAGWYGASYVKASAADVGRYLNALLRGPEDPLGRLLGADVRCRDAPSFSYQVGWEIRSGETSSLAICVLEHQGILPGVNTALALVPDRDLGVAVLINAGIDRAGSISKAALAHLLGRNPPPPARISWFAVADNWALCLAAGAAAIGLASIAYQLRAGLDFKRGRRRFKRSPGPLVLGRSILFAAMAGYLFYLAAGGSMPPRAALPVSVRLAFPLFSTALALLFVSIAVLNLAPPSRDSAPPRTPERR